MRKIAIILALALVLCGALAMSAQATTVPLPLPVGTLADYIALGSTGGTIDDKLFYDFSYVGTGSGGADAIPASGISVTPITTPLNPGLQFTAAWSVGPGQTLDSAISYFVKVLDGGNAIKDVSDAMAGFGAANGGLVTVAETTSVGNLPLLFSNGGTVSFAELTFAPTMGPIAVTKDIAVNGHAAGTAAVSVVTNQFSEVPVPPSALLLGSGLLGLVGFRFRKNRA